MQDPRGELLGMLQAGRRSGHSTMESLALLALAVRKRGFLGDVADEVGAAGSTLRPVLRTLSDKGRVTWEPDGYRLTGLGRVVVAAMVEEVRRAP